MGGAVEVLDWEPESESESDPDSESDPESEADPESEGGPLPRESTSDTVRGPNHVSGHDRTLRGERGAEENPESLLDPDPTLPASDWR